MDGNFCESTENYISAEYKQPQHERHILIIYTIVIAPLVMMGLVGNTVAFCAFGKMVNQNTTTFLLRALAIIDCIVILCMTPRLCATVFSPLWRIAYVATVWTSVVFGMNSYIVVCRPLHAHKLCTITKARKQIVCVILASTVFSLPRLFAYAINTHPNGSFELVNGWVHNKWLLYIYFLGCYSVLIFLLPYGILMFFCVRLIDALHATRVLQMERHGGRQVDTRVTSMLVALLAIPLACHITSILNMLLDLFGALENWVYMYAIVDIAIILNSSGDCLIYLAYMKEFRRKLHDRCTHISEITQEYVMS